MDPNATLAKIRMLAHIIEGGHEDTARDAIDLAEAIQALDGWLTRGGFLPTPWATAPRPTTATGDSL